MKFRIKNVDGKLYLQFRKNFFHLWMRVHKHASVYGFGASYELFDNDDCPLRNYDECLTLKGEYLQSIKAKEITYREI